MSDFSERIRRLTPDQRELLLRRFAHRHDAPGRIPRRASSGDAPVSFAQQRLWFLDQLSPSGGAYHIPLLLSLRGPLNVAALKHSLQAIVDRHDVLRVSFPHTVDGPRQHVAKAFPFPLQVVPLHSPSPELRDSDLRRAAQHELQRPFVLDRGPLIRAALWQLAADEHALLIVLHHIVADGWSLGILLHELAAFYTAKCLGLRPAVEPLPIQYPDFAEWQQSTWAATRGNPHLAFWKETLRGLESLRLPADRPRPAVPSYRGANFSLQLPLVLSRRLDDLCHRHQVTAFTGLLAIMQLLLWQFCGQRDIALGSPIAGRNHSELESLIGCFINTLVLRGGVNEELPFNEHLSKAHEQTMSAFAHQDLPFEKLVEELRPVRDPARNPLVQVLFALQNAPVKLCEMPGLQAGFFDIDSQSSRFDLEFNAWETPRGTRLIASYNSDLFESATIERLLNHFQRLVEAVVIDPSVLLTSLPVLASGNTVQPALQTWQWVTRKASNDPHQSAIVNESSGGDRVPMDVSEVKSALEEQVANGWAAILGVPFVGRNDDFFALGGNSLLAARAVRWLSELLGVPLDVRGLFEARTVREFALYVDTVCWARNAASTRADDDELEF